MMNKSKILRILSLSLAVSGFVMLSGHFAQSYGQTKDPFAKAPYNKTKDASPASSAPANAAPRAPKPKPPGPPPVMPVLAPDINQRIAYYKQQRLAAAESGMPLPKVTSVLTLDEMSITGIFRTPRGYAAMVEAKPINLSYTIYPGEKFFDGQLVAIEENRLVFRKVTKMSNGKFIASVENKALRQYSDKEQIRGTAPVQGGEKPMETASNAVPAAEAKPGAAGVVPTTVVSPVDEMNRQPQTPEPEKLDKKGKKPVKVAKNKK